MPPNSLGRDDDDDECHLLSRVRGLPRVVTWCADMGGILQFGTCGVMGWLQFEKGADSKEV